MGRGEAGWRARRIDLFFVFLEKMTGARKNHFAVNSLNELRAFIRGGLAHHKETQNLCHKYLAMKNNRAPPNLSLLRDFSGYIKGGGLSLGAHFYEHVLVQTRKYKLNNNNNNHHGS